MTCNQCEGNGTVMKSHPLKNGYVTRTKEVDFTWSAMKCDTCNGKGFILNNTWRDTTTLRPHIELPWCDSSRSIWDTQMWLRNDHIRRIVPQSVSDIRFPVLRDMGVIA